EQCNCPDDSWRIAYHYFHRLLLSFIESKNIDHRRLSDLDGSMGCVGDSGIQTSGYAIRTQDVAYRSGLIFRSRQYLPFRRIQHCKITEGLFERLFNFSTVIVSAAGDDIVIHGLRPEEAQNLQQFINEKVDTLTKEMHYGRR